MIELIAELVERGHAYVGGDGVYFAAETIEGYGLLARQPLETCGPGPGSRSARRPASGRRSTSSCGSWPRRASPAGTRRGVRAGPAGTPSAW